MLLLSQNEYQYDFEFINGFQINLELWKVITKYNLNNYLTLNITVHLQVNGMVHDIVYKKNCLLL